jgi:hypothetical protein
MKPSRTGTNKAMNKSRSQNPEVRSQKKRKAGFSLSF